MDEHTVEPDLSSVLSNMRGLAEDGEFIGMKRGRCSYCGRPCDYDDDNAWHVDYDN